jgi:hypothetical protein
VTGGQQLKRGAFLNEVLPKIARQRAAVQIRFIALLKPPFKSSDDYPHVGWGEKADEHARALWGLEV